jgi:orotate phosphoribosyltransferase
MDACVTTPSANSPINSCNMLTLFDVQVRNGLFVAQNDDAGLFSAEKLSQVKYGGNGAALYAYAKRLVDDRLIPRLREVVPKGDPIVVTGTPIRRMANTAKQIAEIVELLLRAAGFNTTFAVIGQEELAGGDYGHLSAEERMLRNRDKVRFFSRKEFGGELGEGKHLIIIDDVFVTGSIVRSTLEMFEKAKMSFLSTTVAVLVQLDPIQVAENAQLEYDLNHTAIKNIKDLYDLTLWDRTFKPNTRVVKFILEGSAEDIEYFARNCNLRILTVLYEGAVNDGYNQMSQYAENFGILSQMYLKTLQSEL